MSDPDLSNQPKDATTFAPVETTSPAELNFLDIAHTSDSSLVHTTNRLDAQLQQQILSKFPSSSKLLADLNGQLPQASYEPIGEKKEEPGNTQKNNGSDDSSKVQVEKLITKLGSNSFAERQRAADELIKLGKNPSDRAAVEKALQLAAIDAPLDLQRQIQFIVTEIRDHYRESLDLSDTDNITKRGALTGPEIEHIAKRYPNLKELNLSGRDLTEDAVKALSSLPQSLRKLDFNSTAVTDEVLKSLPVMKNLEQLNLRSTRVHGEGISKDRFPALKSLDLSSNNLTDKGFDNILKFEKLRSLNLDSTNVNDACIRDLMPLKNLEQINLSGTKISDAGVSDVSKLTKLQSLDLSNTSITDGCFNDLLKLKEIKDLNISSTKITGDRLIDLRELKELRKLTIGDHKLSEKAFKDIQKFTQLTTLKCDASAFETKETDGVQRLLDLQRIMPKTRIEFYYPRGH